MADTQPPARDVNESTPMDPEILGLLRLAGATHEAAQWIYAAPDAPAAKQECRRLAACALSRAPVCRSAHPCASAAR